jgi:hypothetical protein
VQVLDLENALAAQRGEVATLIGKLAASEEVRVFRGRGWGGDVGGCKVERDLIRGMS